MQPLVNKRYKLEKISGKGGWTYVCLPGIFKGKKKPFGWVKVKGSIDSYEVRKYSLMPMGNGKLFLPVKAEIRKKIRKNEGDYVHVTLYPDNEPLETPQEMLLCLQEEPRALKFFQSLPETEQKSYIKWIYSAKKEETKIDRLAKSINNLSKALRFNTID